MNTKKIVIGLNILELLAIIFIIVAAIVVEIFFHELPCPLCILQRFGFLCIAFAFMLNLKYGLRASHYGLALLATLMTAAFSMRQILLHIVPGTAGYGEPIFGLHLYTWTFIICAAFMCYIGLILLFNEQFKDTNHPGKGLNIMINTVCWAIIVLTMINAVTVFLECGFHFCPPDPTSYLY